MTVNSKREIILDNEGGSPFPVTRCHVVNLDSPIFSALEYRLITCNAVIRHSDLVSARFVGTIVGPNASLTFSDVNLDRAVFGRLSIEMGGAVTLRNVWGAHINFDNVTIEHGAELEIDGADLRKLILTGFNVARGGRIILGSSQPTNMRGSCWDGVSDTAMQGFTFGPEADLRDAAGLTVDLLAYAQHINRRCFLPDRITHDAIKERREILKARRPEPDARLGDLQI